MNSGPKAAPGNRVVGHQLRRPAEELRKAGGRAEQPTPNPQLDVQGAHNDGRKPLTEARRLGVTRSFARLVVRGNEPVVSATDTSLDGGASRRRRNLQAKGSAANGQHAGAFILARRGRKPR